MAQSLMPPSFADTCNSEVTPTPWKGPRISAASRTGRGSAQRDKNLLLVMLPGSFALAGIAACTVVSFRLAQTVAFTGFLYLVIVVLTALYAGFWQATVISIAAAACLNYYFVPPVFSLANSPANWAALGAFEFTALVISRLSLRAREQAMHAIAGRRDMERLYETSRRILLLGNSE